ncbi:hypothetical protein ASE86_07755 [Sphingomonas sp. Leaf33]|uniref:hypothetical protein n=1 Tax=Sphingomonas sp. Leaf33 TaxID=1736215 RepID=UPI0006FE7817|nr:hypothetical protein [Sphingomonas sp. Leaf33]KQN26048.1 hypothetical protein ASE86_07755 [Sphingomonas sp. Leaf33]
MAATPGTRRGPAADLTVGMLSNAVTRSHGIRPAYNLIPYRTDPGQRPSPRRLRRVVDQWLPVGHANLIARITLFQHGGHARPVITRGGKHLRFRFTSVVTGTTQIGEGFGERMLARYNEVATRIHDYECHPGELAISRNGRIQTYRPDGIRVLDDGTIELIEVKRTPDDLSDEEYREILGVVAEVARLCGWTFRILHLRDIMGPPAANPRQVTPRVRNVDTLFDRRTMYLTPQEQRTADRIIGRGDPIEWGDLRDQLAPRDALQGDAVIERLLARGRLSTDLDVPFRTDTALVPAIPFTGRSGIRL